VVAVELPTHVKRNAIIKKPPQKGFTLILCLSIMALLTLITIGLMSLASVELRRAGQANFQARAQANARLAMMMAIGNLQKNLGPDQRVSAPAALLADTNNRNWMGVWSTRKTDGTSIYRRDDLNGGLSDSRGSSGSASPQVLNWLVSGNEVTRAAEPSTVFSADQSISMVDRGTLGTSALATDLVKAPLVKIASKPGSSGNYAYWIGDEGVKANLGTVNPYKGKLPSPTSPADGGYFSLLNSQDADASILLGGKTLSDADKGKVLSQRQLDLVSTVGKAAGDASFLSSTAWSQGVLANVRDGRLKRDLTAFVESNKNFPDLKSQGVVVSPGLSTTDNLVGPANAIVAGLEATDWTKVRQRDSSPRFGLLRDWVQSLRGTQMAKGRVDEKVPLAEPRPKIPADKQMAFSNLSPATIASYGKANLSPILVEGSTYFSVSWHNNPAGSPYPYNVRLQTYPRVVLWNPYNAELTLDRTMVMLHVNGRQEMWTDGTQVINGLNYTVRAQWIWFIGGRSTDYSSPQGGGVTNSEGYKDPFIGSLYYSLPKTTFAPGECLVFSPERGAEYNEYALEQNILSANVPPDPSRSFYFTSSELDGGIRFKPTFYWFAPTPYWNIANQADDQRMMLKQLGTSSGITPEAFDSLPQIAYASCSLQYGGGREPRISWAENGKERMENTDLVKPVIASIPNVRTREGYRLRWFREHTSNMINSGRLTGTPFMDEAPLATWNPRAAYATRSPWENIGGALPVTGSGGGPWFFGIYTRDLYDQAVSWNDQMPVYRNGRYTGNPFGTPQEGRERIVLFDVPRADVGLVSLGQLQHVKFSEFVWQPSYAFGNSLADPRMATGNLKGINRTAPLLASAAEKSRGGFDQANIGWSSDTQRSSDGDAWARQGRAIYQDYTDSNNLVYDLSFELNHTIWDDFFLSTGNDLAKGKWLTDSTANPLPNGRMRLNSSSRLTATPSEITDLHRAARHLMLDGAFNVNSTSAMAWESLLRSTKGLMGRSNSVSFPRVLNPVGNEWVAGTGATAQSAWDGYRSLTDAEVKRLSEEIVKQVKLRGPFLSLSDFVNRRLRDDETGRMGPLQAAIEASGLNDSFRAAYPLNNASSLIDYTHPDNIRDSTRLEQTMKPNSKAWGMPGYLTQADVLQVIGPALAARSDTFRVRAYGDALDDFGKIQARAWCECIVQRVPDPVRADDTGINPLNAGKAGDFGRQFRVVSFRWMKREEI
jgi:hypothetical protein